MTEETKKVEVLNEDVMLERGIFTVNGYAFTVKPIYLKEESYYLDELHADPVPHYVDENGEQMSLEDLTQEQKRTWVMGLFSVEKNSNDNKPKKRSLWKRFLDKFVYRYNYHYYDDCPNIYPTIKWLEKKLTCNGQKVKFSELERKYGLNKLEVQDLLIYFHEISCFFDQSR